MSVIKTIGTNGQLSLGKRFAGRAVSIEEREPGVWLIKAGEVIPANERWLHTRKARAILDGALAWSDTHTPKESDVSIFEKQIERAR